MLSHTLKQRVAVSLAPVPTAFAKWDLDADAAQSISQTLVLVLGHLKTELQKPELHNRRDVLFSLRFYTGFTTPVQSLQSLPRAPPRTPRVFPLIDPLVDYVAGSEWLALNLIVFTFDN